MSVPKKLAGPVPGPGVLEKTSAILDAIEQGARTYTQIVGATGYTRPTVHRLVKELQLREFLAFYGGGFHFGPRLLRLAATAMRELPLRDLAHPALERLAESTGEGVQLYIRSGDRRICVDSVQSGNELRTIVDVGATLPLTAGSAGKVFMAWTTDAERARLVAAAEPLTDRTPVADELDRQLAYVRRRGWATSSGERESGVGSVSAPVFGPHDTLKAVVSVSGPASRVGRLSAKRYAPAVLAAALEIEKALGT